MEANLKLLISVSIFVFAIPYLSNSLENEEELLTCPDPVIEKCLGLGRQPCSGRERICGECIDPKYEMIDEACVIINDDDLPGEVEDRVIERLAKEGNQQTDGGSSGADDSKDGGSSQEDNAAVALDTKEANAAVETEESHPKPFTGEIVLEEWQFMLIVGGCIVLAVIGVAIAFYCCYRIQTATKDAEAEYPSYGVTGPGAALSGDRKLAQSAQMYHYQHQKQQMIAMQKREKGESAEDASDYDSEEENEDGDLTVYECPGLAPTGEMQVKNPLFSEEQYKEATPPPVEEKP